MLNDKQRNYIALLKQTLESNLIKNGIQFNPAMNQTQTINSLNEIIDVSKITNENEIAKKELSKMNMIISDLQNDVEKLKKENQDLTNANSQMKMKYDIEKSNKESLNNQIQQEVTKSKTLNDNIQTLQEQNEKIKSNLSEYQAMCSKYENQLFEKGRKINELNNTLNSYDQLQKQYNDNKMLYENLDKNYERLNKEKTDIELSYKKSKDQISELKNKQSELYKQIADNEEKFQKDKKEILEDKEEIQRLLNKSENTINDMKKIIHNKEQEIHKYQETLIENDKQNMKLSNQIDNDHKAYTKQHTEALTEIDILHSKVNDLSSQLGHIKQLYTELQPQYQNVCNDNSEMKTKLHLLEIEKNKLYTENMEVKSLLDNSRKNYDAKLKENEFLNENVIKLKQQNDTFGRELPFWKEKYNKDTKSQENDIMLLKNTVNDLKQQVNDINKQNAKITNENMAINDEYTNTKCELDNMNNAYMKLANENEALKHELQCKLKSIQELENDNDSLQKEKSANVNHIKQLSSKINDVINEKAKFESLTQHQSKQMDEYVQQTVNKDKQHELLENQLLAYHNIIQKCIEVIIANNDKILETNKTNYNINFYTNHFITYIQSLYMLSADNSLNYIDKLNTIESFLEEILKEHFSLISSHLNQNKQLDMLNTKNISLQHNINELVNNMHKANTYIENNENKLKKAYEDNLSYKQSNEDLMNQISSQHTEIERMSFKFNDIMDQNKQLTIQNQQLQNDNHSTMQTLNDAMYQKKAFEDRIVILNKEKKLYDRILNTICNVGNMKKVSNIISDLMGVIDDIAVSEREKIKMYNEGRNVNGIENRIGEKYKEFDMLYEIFQREVEKGVNGKGSNAFRKNGGNGNEERKKDLYLYTSTENNTMSSLGSYSPVKTYGNNYGHRGMKSDFDRYEMGESRNIEGFNRSGQYSLK